MPVHPTEETAPSGLTDKIAAQSKDSTASDHPMHDENKGPIEHGSGSGSGVKTDSSAIQSRGGVKDQNLPEARSKADVDAEAKKLNE